MEEVTREGGIQGCPGFFRRPTVIERCLKAVSKFYALGIARLTHLQLLSAQTRGTSVSSGATRRLSRGRIFVHKMASWQD